MYATTAYKNYLNKKNSAASTARVGRWMSWDEYNKMASTNTVQETYGGGGAAHVAYPANPNAFGRQASLGTIYVEFDVPNNSVKDAGNGWGRIIGPNSIEGRFAKSKGLPVPQFPKAENIKIEGYK